MNTRLLMMALGGAAALGAAAIASGNYGAKDSTKPAVSASRIAANPAAIKAAKTPHEVAERLDSLLQPRFLLRTSEFGVSRIYLPLDSHQFERKEGNVAVRTPLYSLVAANSDEQSLLNAADAAKRPYVIGFLHTANTLGKPDGELRQAIGQEMPSSAFMPRFETLALHDPRLQRDAQQNAQQLSAWQKDELPAVSAAVTACANKIRQGIQVEMKTNGWLLTLRPVKASTTSCLSCHGRAHRGDTLGAMAYAVRTDIVKQ